MRPDAPDDARGCAPHERCWACCPHPPDRVVGREYGHVECLDCHDVFPVRPDVDEDFGAAQPEAEGNREVTRG